MSEITSAPRTRIVACVMTAMAMVAMEMTVVATAMPAIVAEIGGVSLYSWVFSSFVLTQTAMTVVFGKLADVVGRRPTMLGGLAAFLVGSLLAGAAWNMPVMIAARLIQGVGAGAVMPVGLTIIADIYSTRERGRVQGYLASVWAVSAVIGPVAGALITQKLSWAWVFWVNVPVAIAAGVGFQLFLPNDVARRKAPIDYAGAGLFTAAVATVMIALTDTHTASTSRLIACAAVFLLCAAMFVWQERRAADPMISFALWSRRPIAVANGAALVSGMALMGLTTFLPMYVQSVMHRTPVTAGLTLTMVMLGWPIGSTVAARLFPRVALKQVLMIGGLLMPAGGVVFTLLASGSSPILAGIGSLVIGCGMGLISVSSLIMIQELVSLGERASATASNLFSPESRQHAGRGHSGRDHGRGRYGASPLASPRLCRTVRHHVPDPAVPHVRANSESSGCLAASRPQSRALAQQHGIR